MSEITHIIKLYSIVSTQTNELNRYELRSSSCNIIEKQSLLLPPLPSIGDDLIGAMGRGIFLALFPLAPLKEYRGFTGDEFGLLLALGE